MGDIRDPNGVLEAMTDIDTVYHLAALIGIPFSYHSPDTYVDTNVKGTLNIVQAAKALKTSRVLVVNVRSLWNGAVCANYRRAPKTGPVTLFRNENRSRCARRFFSSKLSATDNDCSTLITYGPRQSTRAIIPTIITQLAAGKEEIKLGDLTPTRDLVYVKDTVEGFLRIAQCKRPYWP